MPRFLIHGRDTKSIDFPAGITVINFDRPSPYIYELRSGHIHLTNSRGAIVDYLAGDTFFGEKCLLARPSERQIVTSRTPVQVNVFSKSEFLDRMQRDRRFALRVLRGFAFRLDRYEQAIGELVIDRIEYRLARRLSRLLPPEPASGWVRLEFNPTNPELARTIGTTKWQISHYMRRFQKMGWVERRPDLWIRREGLQEFLESAK